MQNSLRLETRSKTAPALLAIFLGLTGCQIRNDRDDYTAWPKKMARLATTSVCNVRANLNARYKNETLRAEISFNYNRKQPHLLSVLRGPFGQILGKIEIFKSKGIFTDTSGSRPLIEEPVFRELFKGDWTTVTDFFLGIVTKKNAPFILADYQQNPVLLENSGRTIECKYESGADRPQSCSVTATDLKVKIDFASVDCRESLS